MLNIRQTSAYADFMRSLRWKVEKIDGAYVFIRKLPVLPAIIKIQRPNKLPNINKLQNLMRKYHARSISVEPGLNCPLPAVYSKLSIDPYIYTKSIDIDLTPSTTEIFNRFTSAKRRAVRRAGTLGVTVEISDNIEAFIRLKNHTAGLFLGWLTTYGFTRKLWQTFYPDHAKVILAYISKTEFDQSVILGSEATPGSAAGTDSGQARLADALAKRARMTIVKKYVAGTLVLYFGKTAYYWMAAATSEGKRKFAPTLCVWEALKFAKHQGCTKFNFEGVYDERSLHRNRDWQGFSKFKDGFGGKPVYYPQPFCISL